MSPAVPRVGPLDPLVDARLRDAKEGGRNPEYSMRASLILTLPLFIACGEKAPDPVQVCNDAKTSASAAWGAANAAAITYKDGPEATADKEAHAAAQAAAKKAQTGKAVAGHVGGPGGSAVRGATRADASAKSGTAKAAAGKVARYDKLVAATQAAKDASLGAPQAAWDATIAARKSLEGFWKAPEPTPEPYAAALAAGEAAWAACSVVPAAQ